VVAFAIASALALASCSGFLVTPGSGTAGTTGSAGTGSTGAAGTLGAGTAGTNGAAGNAVGTAGTTLVSGSAGRGGTTGAAGTGVAGNGSAGNGSAGNGAGNMGGSAAGTMGNTGTAGTLSRGPTAAIAGVNFPFPQNRPMTGCGYPANYNNLDVMAAYTQWKAETVTSNGAGGALRVQRLATDTQGASTPLNSTVSEGIAYGMMVSVYMNDKATFDGLWSYEKMHRDPRGLMDWAIAADGKPVGTGAATDADEDMAFALMMADKQWGNYMSDALSQVNAVWNNDIFDSKLPKNGDTWGDWGNLNISYFAPAYYRLFKQIDTDATHKWDDVIKTVYDTLAVSLNATNGNLTNGLVPAWCDSTGKAVPPGPGGAPPFHYQYDSCRTPFRIGLDWCWFGEARARDYVAKTSSFFAGIGAANIVDGYDLNGNKHVQFSPANGTPTVAQQSAAFVGPAAVGAMSNPAQYQTFLNDAYARLITRQMLVGGGYYDQSWGVMSLLMLTGNFLNYRAISPYTGP